MEQSALAEALDKVLADAMSQKRPMILGCGTRRKSRRDTE
jgi:hypothetical protein